MHIRLINLEVQWENGDLGEMNFEIYETEDGAYGLICPICGSMIAENGCCNGHPAYELIEENVDKIIDREIGL